MANGPRSRSTQSNRTARAAVLAQFEKLIDLANGTMRLWTGLPMGVTIDTVRFHGPEPERVRGIKLHAYGIAPPPPTPETLLTTTNRGFLGAATVELAQSDPLVARALSLLAAGASQWWQLYILFEILRDSLGQRPNKKSGSWADAFVQLRSRYGTSVDRLEELKQTMNFHRHLDNKPPGNPWRLPEAIPYVHSAIRDWLQDRLSA